MRADIDSFVSRQAITQGAQGIVLALNGMSPAHGKAVAATGKTGADGVFKAPLESLKDLNDVRLFALAKDHAASFNLGLSGLQHSSGLTAKGYLYTDRPIYRPGPTVNFKGILRKENDVKYSLPDVSKVHITIYSPNGENVLEGLHAIIKLVIMHLKSLDVELIGSVHTLGSNVPLILGEIERFPFLDPPDTRQIRDGIALLQELGALKDKKVIDHEEFQHVVTPGGRRIVVYSATDRFIDELIAARKAVEAVDHTR